MDIQPRTKVKAQTSVTTSKYPHDMQLYVQPPASQIFLFEFRELAFNRLKILRIIEEVTLRGRTKYSEDWRNTILNQLRKQGLKKFASLFSSTGTGNVGGYEDIRKDDHISHFILRLAHCSSQEKQNWFIQREIELFRLRFSHLSPEGVRSFIEINKLGYAAISSGEKMEVFDSLVQASGSSPSDVELTDYFKVRFENVPDLVRARKVFLRLGLAYVPATELVHILTSTYRGILNRGLQALSYKLPFLERDVRFAFLRGLSDAYIGRDYSCKTEGQDALLPEHIDLFAVESFPPCMQRVHNQLRSTHHLHHTGRLRYSLFLKGAGLSFENAFEFFRDEYTKTNPQKFEKEYSYTIKHNYGKVGRCIDYTPYSCVKLITETPGEGSCPFKFESRNELKTWISSFSSNSQDVQSILQYVDSKQFGQACSKYFEMNHGQETETIISHPNQYFEESRRLRTGKKDEKCAERFKGKSRTMEQIPVKDSSGAEGAFKEKTKDLDLKMEDFDEWDGD